MHAEDQQLGGGFVANVRVGMVVRRERVALLVVQAEIMLRLAFEISPRLRYFWLVFATGFGSRNLFPVAIHRDAGARRLAVLAGSPSRMPTL